jgi:hypothetical protein
VAISLDLSRIAPLHCSSVGGSHASLIVGGDVRQNDVRDNATDD